MQSTLTLQATGSKYCSHNQHLPWSTRAGSCSCAAWTAQPASKGRGQMPRPLLLPFSVAEFLNITLSSADMLATVKDHLYIAEGSINWFSFFGKYCNNMTRTINILVSFKSLYPKVKTSQEITETNKQTKQRG